MAEMTIRLRCDPATGKKDIVISLRSEADALPQEHEQQHRALVEKLIAGGLLKAGELGQVVVEREGREEETAPPVGTPPQAERWGEKAFIGTLASSATRSGTRQSSDESPHSKSSIQR